MVIPTKGTRGVYRRGFIVACGVLVSGCLHDNSEDQKAYLVFAIEPVSEGDIPPPDRNYTYTLENEKLREVEDLKKALREKQNGTFEEGHVWGVYNYEDSATMGEMTKKPEDDQPYFYIKYKNNTYKIITTRF